MADRRRSGATPILLVLCSMLAIAPVAASSGAPAGSQDEGVSAAIASRIDALRQRLVAIADTMHANFKDYAAGLVEQLDAAEQANDAGLTFAALGIIREVEPPVAGIAFHTAHGATVTTRQQYAALDESVAPGLRDRAAAVAAHGWEGRPLALLAMGQRAVAQVPTLIDGGRGFGADAGALLDGILYLGIAEGTVELAEWLSSLPLQAGPPPAPLPGLEAAVAHLDAEVLRAYEDPGAQLDQHPAFIRASSAVKMADSLLRQDLRASALLAYLEGERGFAELAAPPDAAPGLDELQALDDELVRRLGEGNFDHSIGVLFEQLARRRLMQARTAAPEEAPDLLAGAAVLLRRVVPRYFDVVAGTAIADTTPLVDTEVTVTLVRWPFT